MPRGSNEFPDIYQIRRNTIEQEAAVASHNLLHLEKEIFENSVPATKVGHYRSLYGVNKNYRSYIFHPS